MIIITSDHCRNMLKMLVKIIPGVAVFTADI